MSKLTKLVNNPLSFLKDAIENKRILLIRDKTPQQLINRNIPENINKKFDKGQKDLKLNKSLTQKIPQEVYVNYLIEAKTKLALNKFKYEGLNLWPFLRAELMVQLEIAFNKQIKGSNFFNPYQTQLCRPSNVSHDMAYDLAKNREYMSLIDEIEDQENDILFFSNLNSTDHVKYDGKIYNRLIDPLIDELSKEFTCKKIEIIKATSKAVDKIPLYYNRPTCVLPSNLFTGGYSSKADFPYKFLESLNKNIPVIEFTEGRINSFIDWQMHMIDFYTKLLRKFNPKIILFHPYYYNMPLVTAAKRMNIMTADIQHGVMHGYNSMLYDNWQELPISGYKALPDIFFTWSDKEANYLNEVVLDNNTHHKAIPLGYKWLEFNSKSDNQITKMISNWNCDYKILVSLQKDNVIPNNILKIMKQQDSILWIIRAHPKGNKVIESQVQDINNVLFGSTIDEILISDLFKAVDFNITSGSTTVLEADFYNVKSFVYSKEGLLNYKEYIDEGLVKYIDSSIESIDLIELDNFIKSPSIGYFKREIDIIKVFKDLIGS
ncbi:hypothetical protein [Psychrobacter sp. NC44]|uniref:hypothetical protein n=1 Tax=Psychrobacter sp. NC44 TaxID=2774130 RepID=UPI00191B02E0|nr:hypothetical protein [Psychrobacter sp. NC44]